MAILVEEHAQSVLQACEIAGLSRTAFYRPARVSVDADAPITVLTGVPESDHYTPTHAHAQQH